MIPGHVFVVHSRMEDLQYDAAIVPTGRKLSVRSYWQPVLRVPTLQHDPGHLDTTTVRPPAWPQPFARIPVTQGAGPTRPTWFIDSTGPDVDTHMANLAGVLEDVATASLTPGAGRAHPLVVLNAIGVGGGGFGRHRGAVIDRLLTTCQHFADAHAIDLAITTPNAADYAAMQHRRRRLNAFPTLSPNHRAQGERLADLARNGHLALFLGAGVSIPAGLPSWGDLLARLRDASRTRADELKSLGSPLDQAELLQRRLGGGLALKDEIAAAFAGTTIPGLSHLQLATLGCREVITTNYDSLYEAAVKATRPQADAITVLPFEQQKPFGDWILKMHGDLAHEGGVVLSRSDFVGYAGEAGPVGAIVQALMLTKHLLVVGTSLTDDNFLRLAYEVTNYLRKNPGGSESAAPPEIGTVLTLRHEPAKRDLWQGTFTVLGMADTSASVGEQARALSIMLDYIAMWAAKDDWLLDERYAALLDDQEAEVAELARDLHRRVQRLATRDDSSRGWQRLSTLLATLGASTDQHAGWRRPGDAPLPQLAAPRHRVAQGKEDGDDDRGRPASGLGFEDDGNAADHDPGAPGELSQRDPGEAASDRMREAADEVPGDAPGRPEQVEAGVAVAEASDALRDQSGDLAGVDLVGAIGGHDVAAQEDVTASRGGDGRSARNDPETDAVGIQMVSGDPPGQDQPGRLGWGGVAGAVRDPDDGVLAEAGREQRTEGDPHGGDSEADGGGEGGDDDQPEQAADEDVRDDDGGLE